MEPPPLPNKTSWAVATTYWRTTGSLRRIRFLAGVVVVVAVAEEVGLALVAFLAAIRLLFGLVLDDAAIVLDGTDGLLSIDAAVVSVGGGVIVSEKVGTGCFLLFLLEGSLPRA